MEDIIGKARALLQNAKEGDALALLTPEVAKDPENVPLLEIFGESLLEANDVETAYNVLKKATQLDPQAALGVDKFLYLGQIIGGQDGCAYLDSAILKVQEQLLNVKENKGELDPVLQGLARLYPTSDLLSAYLIKKLNQAIFAEIEIWMTDLCMEPEAEAQCDKLISHSLAMDNNNPEAHSLLALIRISQQRPDEAKQALTTSWQLFSSKKLDLEQQQNSEGDESSFEYVELVQPLLGLSRFAIELAMYDIVPEICSAVSDINDNALDCYYLESLSHILKAKRLYSELNSVKTDYRDLDNSVLENSSDEKIVQCLQDAKSSLTQGYRVMNSADAEASDPDVITQVSDMLQAFGGPVMSELMPSRQDDEDLNDGWEDELEDE